MSGENVFLQKIVCVSTLHREDAVEPLVPITTVSSLHLDCIPVNWTWFIFMFIPYLSTPHTILTQQGACWPLSLLQCHVELNGWIICLAIFLLEKDVIIWMRVS